MTSIRTAAKWIFLLLPSAVIIAAIAVALTTRLLPDHRPENFISHWAETFRDISTPDDLTAIPAEDRPDLVFIRRFSSGEWVIARSEHSCSDGAGFDATLFKDSSGRVRYQTGHHFCGFEGLHAELDRIDATNVTDFYESLTGVELKEWTMNGQPAGGAYVSPAAGAPSAHP